MAKVAPDDKASDDTFPGFLHETTKKDKGKKLAFGSFRSPPLIDAKNTDMSPLQVIFDLNKVLVRKEYFRINHLLLPLFNLAHGCILLGKSVVPKPTLKEFLLRCLEQFTVYIWTSPPLAKMNAYLKKIAKETSIEIDP